MTAIVTDAHYRMAAALIRDLVDAGIRVIVCEKNTESQPIGFVCRGIDRSVFLSESAYQDELYALCDCVRQQTGEKPALLPVGAATLSMLAENRERFSAVCCMAVADSENLALLNDKRRAAALAGQLGIAVPAVYRKSESEDLPAFFSRVDLPCIVKPACGEKFGLSAAQRYRIARTEKELQDAFIHFSSVTGEVPIVQEYLPGDGFGCSILAKDGTVYASICHKRIREWPVTGGPSSCCETADMPQLILAAKKMAEAIGFTGAAMFEFKEDAIGRPRFLECNPRVWGTYPLTRVSGSNFALCWLHAAMGDTIPPYVSPKPMRMVFYPSDFASALGYLRKGNVKKSLETFCDLLNPRVKNGLFERNDPMPGRVYLKNLRKRGGKHDR
ncbi:MAG: ATP-grasp domain-containing protein [Clostridia bacterium]|nr:ATP-grasp domain-containing protein [Clostridia bacterium]